MLPSNDYERLLAIEQGDKLNAVKTKCEEDKAVVRQAAQVEQDIILAEIKKKNDISVFSAVAKGLFVGFTIFTVGAILLATNGRYLNELLGDFFWEVLTKYGVRLNLSFLYVVLLVCALAPPVISFLIIRHIKDTRGLENQLIVCKSKEEAMLSTIDSAYLEKLEHLTRKGSIG